LILSQKRHKDYTNSYQEVLDQWLSEGIIGKVLEEVRKHSYYSPHRHVIKENSTTKIKFVFDTSATEKDGFLIGIWKLNLIEQIPDILLRFRQYKFAVTADIRKAFLQSSLRIEMYCVSFGREKLTRKK